MVYDNIIRAHILHNEQPISRKEESTPRYYRLLHHPPRTAMFYGMTEEHREESMKRGLSPDRILRRACSWPYHVISISSEMSPLFKWAANASRNRVVRPREPRLCYAHFEGRMETGETSLWECYQRLICFFLHLVSLLDIYDALPFYRSNRRENGLFLISLPEYSEEFNKLFTLF